MLFPQPPSICLHTHITSPLVLSIFPHPLPRRSHLFASTPYFIIIIYPTLSISIQKNVLTINQGAYRSISMIPLKQLCASPKLHETIGTIISRIWLSYGNNDQPRRCPFFFIFVIDRMLPLRRTPCFSRAIRHAIPTHQVRCYTHSRVPNYDGWWTLILNRKAPSSLQVR